MDAQGTAAAPAATVLSLPELHGALTHLPIVALGVLALLSVLAWRGIGGEQVRRAEQWAFAASFAGIALAGLSGLLVNGQAKTTLRGSDAALGSLHLYLGIVTGLVLLGLGARRLVVWRRGERARFATPAGAGVVLFAAVAAMGWLGGQMTYQQAVGVSSGGELARSAQGAEQLAVALASGTPPARAGRQAFQSGLGCAACHGMQAQGQRGPPLSGGRELRPFAASTDRVCSRPPSSATSSSPPSTPGWPPIRRVAGYRPQADDPAVARLG